jgi:hypothetical protein
MEDFKLTFTGKMSILVELEEHGPLQYNINDMDVVLDVLRTVLNATDNKTPVNSYNKREEKTLRKLLDVIK